MRAVWSWLGELCELDRAVDADEGARVLTAAGLEIEEITRIGSEFSGVVVAEVVSAAKHPKADKLTLVEVIDRDGGSPTTVVCGAPNVPAPGGRVLWARPGARLPGGFEIGKRELKGVLSAGMLCSQKELDIGDDDSGIVVLAGGDRDVDLGADAASALGLSEVVFEVGVPANRPDALGHVGLARELVALVGGRMRPLDVDLSAVTDESLIADELVAVDVDDPAQCRRYVARVIDGVRIGPSPLWMQQRLRAVGVRPLSNLVDVTNYVMFELGQPLHAFDAARLSGSRISVRGARPDERLVTLDEVERDLVTEDLVIADDSGAVALAGVMGGQSTEVGDSTQRVLLESANFEPLTIRRTARRLGLHSESSYRFERAVDPNIAGQAAARAALLFARLASGRVAAGAVDAHPAPLKSKSVAMRASRATALTGVEFGVHRARELLERLGCQTEAQSEDVVMAHVPTARPDLTREVDLIEEVMRLHGFDKVPATLPPSTVEPSRRLDRRPLAAREALVREGLSEAVTFGFTSPERIEHMRFAEDDRRARALVIDNPMTVEQSVLRTSLWPNLLAAVARNLAHEVRDVALFEIGPVFLPRSNDDLADEPRRVAAVLSGRSAGWLVPGDEYGVHDAVGVMEAVVQAVMGPSASAVELDTTGQIPFLHPGISAVIRGPGPGCLGEIGEVHPQVRKAFDIAFPVFGFELDLEALEAPKPLQMTPIARYPAITRDISFFVQEDVEASKIKGIIAECAPLWLDRVAVLEDYRDRDRVPTGQKGMLWSLTYRSPERTLTDAEVDGAHKSLEEALLGQLSATRR